VCHLDEAGFAMTLPVCRSWFPVGERLAVPSEAPQGRRGTAIGAHFTHGPEAGRFACRTRATLPKSRAKRPRKTPAEVAAAHGLPADEVGPIDAERFLAFVWQLAGRKADAPAGWRRERPLRVVPDNYSVHTRQAVAAASPQPAGAGVHWVYLPAYCPQLSAIEPEWNEVKQHQLPVRSFAHVADLKRAGDDALECKAHQLQQRYAETTNIGRSPT
jgi:hypothetical protein